MPQVVPLGAGQEVGRSCIIVKYGGKTVMLDCGVHPGFFGLASLPFFDEVCAAATLAAAGAADAVADTAAAADWLGHLPRQA